MAGLSNQQISDDAQRLHDRLARIDAAFPEIQSVWIFDQNGRALVTSLAPVAPTNDFSGRDYFAAHLASPSRRFVGKVNQSPFGGQPFNLRRWQQRDIVRPLFQTKADGLRQYRTCLLMMPRKNGKTEKPGSEQQCHCQSGSCAVG